MIVDERTLILVADGRRARLFEERVRGGPLHERSEVVADARFEAAPSRLRPTTSSSMREGRHTVETLSPKQKGERRFLAEVADRVASYADKEPFDQIVLIAAPKVLGALRKSLPAAMRRRLIGDDPHDRIDADETAIRAALAQIRRARS